MATAVEKFQAEIDKLKTETVKLEAETNYLIERSKTEIPRLFFYGIGTAAAVVVGLASITNLMAGK